MTAKGRRKNNSPPCAISSRSKTVVEDEASIREITQAALEAYGYSVMTASGGSRQ